MSRLPFDSSRMTGRPPPPRPTEDAQPKLDGQATPAKPVFVPVVPRHITVTQLASMIQQTLKEHTPPSIKVAGELGQFRERTHWYFDVKDEGACVSCVMWQTAARKVGFEPKQGQQVLLTGHVEYYPPFGKTQFVVAKMEPIGAGALDLAFKQLMAQLKSLGWFETIRKRPLPLLPRKVAIVTSKGGAALQDVLDTVGRRCPALPLALADVRVQGDGAAEQIARTIRAIGACHGECGIDVILVTRGGGSMEDLWAFNERIVAEAIVRSPIPVVAAIGHETDTTIAELVADLRCATPTQAAMRIAPDAAALRQQLASFASRLRTEAVKRIRLDSERLRGASRHAFFAEPARVIDDKKDELRDQFRQMRHALLERLQHATARLDRASQRLGAHRPEAVYARREAELRHAGDRLRSALLNHLHRRSTSLESTARSLDLVGPHNVLKRGFSVTLRPDGSVLRSSADAKPGDVLQTRLADGSVASTVNGDGVRSLPLRPMPPARKPRKSSDDRNQMGLF